MSEHISRNSDRRSLDAFRGFVPWRILVADDDMAEQIGCVLDNELGADVTTVLDGQVALEAASETPFDLWLINYRMPHLNGVEVLTRLRERGPTAPAVIISAWPREAVPEPTDHLAIDDWITKPFSTMALTTRLKTVLAANGGQSNN